MQGNQAPVIQGTIAIDDFDSVEGWKLATTDGIIANISIHEEAGRKALRLDYDFAGRSGYALIRKQVDMDLPENYVFTYDLKAESPPNSLEMKLVDHSGDNVWWVQRPAFTFPKDWRQMRNKARHFTYAWGPDRARLVKVGFLELVVSATSGGKGTIFFDDLKFKQLPPPTDWAVPAVSVSSGVKRAGCLADPNCKAPWHSDGESQQEVVFDYGSDIEFGGVEIHWDKHDFAREFSLDVKSSDGNTWETLFNASDNRVDHSFLYLPESEGRFIRVRMSRSARGTGYGIKKLAIKPLAFSATPASFWQAVAAAHPRGSFPRYLENQQSYWTVIGAYGDSKKALINEEGMIEVEKLGFSIEPFVYTGGKLLSWADGTHSQRLHNEWMPIPSVVRTHDGLELTITPVAVGAPGKSVLHVQYTLRNTSDKRTCGKLFLGVRQFQVNPPWQFLNAPGGFAPIKMLTTTPNCIRVNGKKSVVSISPSNNGVTQIERGDAVEWMRKGTLPPFRNASNSDGFASGVFAYRFRMKPGEQRTFEIAVPFHKAMDKTPFVVAKQQAIDFWNDKFAALRVSLPASPDAKDLELTVKAQLAYILVNRNGPRIQPGTRCYDRSWARDGALTSCALLEFGFRQEVREFIDWFSPHQFEDGKIPCVVDDRGADPTPEHDSPGEFLFLLAEYYRYTKDKDFLRLMFPQAVKTVAYIEQLLAQTRTPEFSEPSKVHLRGLLPPSISHEGYSDKPAYSYWDDFWCLRGLEDAVFLAHEYIGCAPVTGQFEAVRDQFKSDLYASIRACMAKYKMAGIPGAADRGDFDPCSTTIAIDPGMLTGDLEPELRRTFELYWHGFLERKFGLAPWEGYTPYEFRAVGSLLRLGSMPRAWEALTWFMGHRRPLGWRHWGEVVHNDPLTPKFIGDMPHGWVGSDFLRSARSLLVYEREEGTLVIGAGFLQDWWHNETETFFALPTKYGTIEFRMEKQGETTAIELSGDATANIVLQVATDSNAAYINGRAVPREYQLGKLPSSVLLNLNPPATTAQ